MSLSVEVLFDERHSYRPIRQKMVRQNADGAAAGHAQETRDVLLLLVIAVGVTIIRAVNMHLVIGVQGTGRPVPSKT
jgi:hypothetical protein